MKVRSIDIVNKKNESETFILTGRESARAAIRKLAAPLPPMPPGQENAPAGLQGPQNGLDGPPPGPEDPMAPKDELGAADGNSNLTSMVKGISHKYLSDKQLDEIGQAVMELIAYVPDKMRTDLAKDFGKYMEASAILKATLNSFVLLTTPPRNMEQIFQFPEQQQDDTMQSDIMT